MQADIGDSCYLGGDALSCLLDQLVAAFGGEALLGVVMGGLIFAVFWIAADGDLATPTVALILSGTVITAMVPGSYQQIAGGVVLIGLAAALFQGLQKYVLSGVTQ